jgi:hypothetical protein
VVDLHPDEQAALNSNRAWQIAAAQGDVDSPTALAYVRSLHDTYQAWASRDPQMVRALDIGDQRHWDDDRRWYNPADADPQPDYDPATTAVFDQLVQQRATTYEDFYEDGPFLDWSELFSDDTPDDEWLYDDVFALGRGHAFYAQHKQGKSLFVLWVAAELATRRSDVDVVYLDYEMTRSDVRERLEDMGYGPDSDLSRLHYALLPSIAPLDTMEGAGALLDLVDSVHVEGRHVFVVVDTTARAAQGNENDSDTFRDFYRCTGIVLKRRGITWARLDHAGKDPTKGQRGSSGKGDDVDVIWRLQQADNGVVLHRDAARMSWVGEKVTFTLRPDPLRYERSSFLWPAGTTELAAVLDDLDVPLGASRRAARQVLSTAGQKATNDVLGKALQWRQQRVQIVPDHCSDHSPDPQTDHSTDQTPNNALTRADQSTDHLGPVSAADSDRSPPLRGDQVRAGPPTITPPPVQRMCRCGQLAADISGLCPGCIANPGTGNNTPDF